MLNACQTMCNASFMTIYSVASSLTAFSAWDVTPARKRCSWPSVASGGGFVRHVRAGGWPRPRPTSSASQKQTWSSASPPRLCRRRPPSLTAALPLGADAAKGSISAYSLTLFDVLIKRINGKDPYDSPHHDLAVLCQPGGQAWRRAAEGSTRVGDVYP